MKIIKWICVNYNCPEFDKPVSLPLDQEGKCGKCHRSFRKVEGSVLGKGAYVSMVLGAVFIFALALFFASPGRRAYAGSDQKKSSENGQSILNGQLQLGTRCAKDIFKTLEMASKLTQITSLPNSSENDNIRKGYERILNSKRNEFFNGIRDYSAAIKPLVKFQPKAVSDALDVLNNEPYSEELAASGARKIFQIHVRAYLDGKLDINDTNCLMNDFFAAAKLYLPVSSLHMAD